MCHRFTIFAAMSTYNESFRDRIEGKRLKRGWTRVKLAQRAGLPNTTVATILTGDGEFHYSAAMAIEDALRGKRVNNEDGS